MDLKIGTKLLCHASDNTCEDELKRCVFTILRRFLAVLARFSSIFEQMTSFSLHDLSMVQISLGQKFKLGGQSQRSSVLNVQHFEMLGQAMRPNTCFVQHDFYTV